MSSTIRIPPDIHQSLQEIRLSLESRHFSAAPTLQDIVSVALKRFIQDWNNSGEQEQILETLLQHRQEARSRMGKKLKLEK
ncbi:hypothetical protein V0288_14295 [Pannus brasiliensis CCIBt3594]|uniref:Ribbon-helix-helix protein CopG domain-containing protein n=1 Tax=Pannus brasiliensis CCIBt3594 TaxID=1427578 RepID=A0AAW9QTT4_9CHRO